MTSPIPGRHGAHSTTPVKKLSRMPAAIAPGPAVLAAPATTVPLTFEPLLTAAEVASVLNVSLRQVRRMIAAGDLKILRFGTAVRIRRGDLAALLAAAASE